MDKKVALVILDGWGKGVDDSVSAISQANTPVMDGLYQKYPNAELVTFGEQVGLPEGQIGNSEVGHMNLGAGRVVYQELARINKAIRVGDLNQNEVFQGMISHARSHTKRIHLMGLVSDGGVHSSIEHLLGICDLLKVESDIEIFIHVFTDGRDTPPGSAKAFVQRLHDHIEGSNARIATVVGRFYAMDRDNRWERISKVYNLLVRGMGDHYSDAMSGIQASYDAGINDEFIEPIVVGTPEMIEAQDAVFFINFRTDRPREISRVLTQADMPEHGMHKLDLHYVTMTSYDSTFKNVHVVFTKDNLKQTIGEVLAQAGKTQLRIAETEKYPHVTFFFNGGEEQPYEGEGRIVIPSPKVKTYDLQPEMSAKEVADAAIGYIQETHPDFICLNFANTDMVGHTGIMSAAIAAAEAVDTCLGRLVDAAIVDGYEMIIIADHGNADIMSYPDGSPHTAHTLSMVPMIVVTDRENIKVRNGKLGDIAPTILTMMGVAIPKEMTGDVLIG